MQPLRSPDPWEIIRHAARNHCLRSPADDGTIEFSTTRDSGRQVARLGEPYRRYRGVRPACRAAAVVDASIHRRRRRLGGVYDRRNVDRRRHGMTLTPMEGALFFLGTIAVLVWIVLLVDWWGRRKDRRRHERPAR